MDLTPSTQGMFSLFIYSLSLCSREKIDLNVGGSLASSSRSPLTVFFFFFFSSSHQTTILARSIQSIDSCTSSIGVIYGNQAKFLSVNHLAFQDKKAIHSSNQVDGHKSRTLGEWKCLQSCHPNCAPSPASTSSNNNCCPWQLRWWT